MDNKWEFNCPQFVDFAAGLDDVSEDVFSRNSKKEEKEILTSSLINDAVGPKMATPYNRSKKIIKSSKILKNSPYVNTCVRPIQTDDEKLATLGNRQRRLSKSDIFVNRIGIDSPKLPMGRKIFRNFRKRSLSENCLKVKNKMCPITPMCLKRTAFKPKSRGKTTEELEMEKITQLRNQVARQLKLNQVNLERMKLNKAPYVLDEFYKIKCKVANPSNKEDRKENKPIQQVAETKKNSKTKDSANDHCSENFPDRHVDNHALTLKNKGDKLQKILNAVRSSSSTAPASSTVSASPTSMAPMPLSSITSVSSYALRVINADNKEARSGQHKKYSAHCGIKFLPHQKGTTPHPFSFDTSSASLVNSSIKVEDATVSSLSSSIWKSPNLTLDKENFLQGRRTNTKY